MIAISPSPATVIAGESFTFTCAVTLSEGDSETPRIEWTDSVDFDADITEGMTQATENPSIFTRTLQFVPVQISHRGQYTCQASTTAGTNMESELLNVQSEFFALYTYNVHVPKGARFLPRTCCFYQC